MIKILLTSDLHLGIRDRNIPITDVVRINTFRKIAALACEHDLLFIAGDLVHHAGVTDEIIEFITAEFGRITEHGTGIVYTPGDSELGDDGIIPPYLQMLDVARLFTPSNFSDPLLFEKDGERVYVYGLPGDAKTDIGRIERADPEGFHVGLFHACVNLADDERESGVIVLKKKDLKALNLDFYALGHDHNYKIYKNQGVVIGAYPGSPEASGYGETGERFVLSLVVGEGRVQQIKRLTVNTKTLNEVTVDATGLGGQQDLFERVEECKSPGSVVRLVISGERNFRWNAVEMDEYRANFDALVVCDESTPTLKVIASEFCAAGGMKGEFFSLLAGKLEGEGIPADVDRGALEKILLQLASDGDRAQEGPRC